MSLKNPQGKKVRFGVTVSISRARQLKEIADKYDIEPAAVARILIAKALDAGVSPDLEC